MPLSKFKMMFWCAKLEKVNSLFGDCSKAQTLAFTYKRWRKFAFCYSPRLMLRLLSVFPKPQFAKLFDVRNQARFIRVDVLLYAFHVRAERDRQR